MARKITRDPNALTIDDLPRMIVQYKDAATAAKQLNEQADRMKERMRKLLVAEGYSDPDGHLWVDVDGVPGVKQGLKHEKRKSDVLDREKMIEWLKSHNDEDGNPLWDQCKATVEVLDEDAFWSLVYDEQIPKRVINKYTEEKVTWAFRIV